MDVTVAIDCMGGDHGPHVTVPAALEFVRSNPRGSVILIGLESEVQRELAKLGALHEARVSVRHASEQVEMHDSAAVALRNKKNSSMRAAIDLVKRGEAQAAVSAGNTGALMAISRFVLKTLPGIDRPAIVSVLPTVRGNTYMLDLGANVDCAPEHLLQFALMGATLVAAVEHKERPTVGLLNIGEEAIKGNEVVKQAAKMLRESGLNFQGNVEGGDIYDGKTDIVVCDGFVGNVALKSSEGVARMLGSFLRQEFQRSWFNRLAALCARPALAAFKRRIDPRRYNGASLLGLRGIVVKSHGSADSYAFRRAIERAMEEVETEVLQRLTERLAPAGAVQ